nr:hypothetical protein [Tanacetum cinerariifolium]
MRCGSGLSKGLCLICENNPNPNSLNDSPNISENIPQSPPLIDHHCCYGCGDSLDGFFCQQCTCKSRENGAHYGYNCPPMNDSMIELHEMFQAWLQQQEQVVNIDSYSPEPSQCRKIPIYYDDDDDEESSTPLRDIISRLPLSDEVIKYSVEDLVPIPRESEENFKTFLELETFKFDMEEKNSGSTTIYADISLLDFDHFYFKIEPDPGELNSNVDSGIRENVLSATNMNLSPEDDQSPLFAYVVWIFLPFLTYPVAPPYLISFGNEDIIFDPGISIYHSFKPDVSHRCGTFIKFNVYPSLLNESPMLIHGENTPNFGDFLDLEDACSWFCPSITQSSHPQLHFGNSISKSYRLTLSFGILNKRH